MPNLSPRRTHPFKSPPPAGWPVAPGPFPAACGSGQQVAHPPCGLLRVCRDTMKVPSSTWASLGSYQVHVDLAMRGPGLPYGVTARRHQVHVDLAMRGLGLPHGVTARRHTRTQAAVPLPTQWRKVSAWHPCCLPVEEASPAGCLPDCCVHGGSMQLLQVPEGKTTASFPWRTPRAP